MNTYGKQGATDTVVGSKYSYSECFYFCPAGSYNPNPSGGASSSDCVNCDAGKYAGGVPGSFSFTGLISCLACEAGKYSSTLAAESCADCVAGRYSSATGATSSDKCLACVAGSYSSSASSSCTECEAGKYSSTDAIETCTECAAGRYNSATGAASSDACLACDAGSYSSSASSSCTECEAGKYSLTAAAETCNGCVAGRYSSAIGAKTTAVCAICPAGEGELIRISISTINFHHNLHLLTRTPLYTRSIFAQENIAAALLPHPAQIALPDHTSLTMDPMLLFMMKCLTAPSAPGENPPKFLELPQKVHAKRARLERRPLWTGRAQAVRRARKVRISRFVPFI